MDLPRRGGPSRIHSDSRPSPPGITVMSCPRNRRIPPVTSGRPPRTQASFKSSLVDRLSLPSKTTSYPEIISAALSAPRRRRMRLDPNSRGHRRQALSARFDFWPSDIRRTVENLTGEVGKIHDASSSTRPNRTTPDAAKASAAGDPNPPAPTISADEPVNPPVKTQWLLSAATTSSASTKSFAPGIPAESLIAPHFPFTNAHHDMFGVGKGRTIAKGNRRVFILLRKISVFVRMAVKNSPENFAFFFRLAEDYARIQTVRSNTRGARSECRFGDRAREIRFVHFGADEGATSRRHVQRMGAPKSRRNIHPDIRLWREHTSAPFALRSVACPNSSITFR